jgi:hypothetical protein
MSSDPNELIRLLLAQQQQQQQQQQDVETAQPHNKNQQLFQQIPQQSVATAPNTNASFGPAASASAISASNNGTQLLAPTAASNPAAQPKNTVQQQQQSLMQSAELLANINPALAVMAMEQALALGPLPIDSFGAQQPVSVRFHHSLLVNSFELRRLPICVQLLNTGVRSFKCSSNKREYPESAN